MVDEVLCLSQEDVIQAVPMADAIEAIELACKEQSNGGVIVGERQNLRFPGGWIRLMPAAMIGSGVFGYKEFHLVAPGDDGSRQAEVRYAVHLFDASNGRPLAVVDANFLTALRTGAASGVATARLATAGATELAVIGSGAEARAQAQAVLAVRPVTIARVFGRDRARRERFAEEMSARLEVGFEPVASAQEAIRGAGIVVVATLTDGEPALCGEWLEAGQHVTSIGSTMPSQREIDVEVWRRANCTILDTLQLLTESGDGIAAVAEGAVDKDRVGELSDLVVGRVPGRTSKDEITLYKSVGTGMQDLAVAELAYRRANEQGIGLKVPQPRSVKLIKPN
ncbi:MAG: ornithine cyclodeaminase family protein [Acidimicrobiales bacterium]